MRSMMKIIIRNIFNDKLKTSLFVPIFLNDQHFSSINDVLCQRESSNFTIKKYIWIEIVYISKTYGLTNRDFSPACTSLFKQGHFSIACKIVRPNCVIINTRSQVFARITQAVPVKRIAPGLLKFIHSFEDFLTICIVNN